MATTTATAYIHLVTSSVSQIRNTVYDSIQSRQGASCTSQLPVRSQKKSHQALTSAAPFQEYSSLRPLHALSHGGSRKSSRVCRSSSSSQARHGRHITTCSASDVDDFDFSEMNFGERLGIVWRILFPPRPRPPSIAEIAKERLRVVLISDRGEVSPEVRRLIRSKVIEAMSEFVEVVSEDEVEVKLAADPALGTIYSVTVPVRRVRPEWQEVLGEMGFRDRVFERRLREADDEEDEEGGGSSGGSLMRLRFEGTELGRRGSGEGEGEAEGEGKEEWQERGERAGV